jgi:hypothetical protein
MQAPRTDEAGCASMKSFLSAKICINILRHRLALDRVTVTALTTVIALNVTKVTGRGKTAGVRKRKKKSPRITTIGFGVV